MATFFFFLFFLEPGLKLDKKSIENGLEGQKCSVGGLFCLSGGGCHHPNNIRIMDRFTFYEQTKMNQNYGRSFFICL